MSKRESGFTVIEMLISVTLASIVGAITTTVIVQGFHQQAATDARTAAVAHVRTALQRTMRELRQATLTSLTPTSLGMTEETNNGGTRTLNYTVETSNGVTSLFVNDGTTKSIVVTNLVNDASQNVFTPTARPTYQPMNPGTVNTSTCQIIGQTPTAYAPECTGIVIVHLRVMPTDASGHALCDTTGGCVIDVSDDAGIRNNP